MTIRRSILSSEFVRVSVSALEGSALIDLATDVVELAVVLGTTGSSGDWTKVDPGPGDWQEAEWEDAEEGALEHFARRLQSELIIGPPFTLGRYGVWARVTDHPEVPVQMVYTLLLT